MVWKAVEHGPSQVVGAWAASAPKNEASMSIVRCVGMSIVRCVGGGGEVGGGV